MPAPMRRRGGPPQPISGFLDLRPGNITEAAAALAAARAHARAEGRRLPDPYVPSQPPAQADREEARHAPVETTPEADAGGAPSPASAEPRPNSPEDVGFTNSQTCEPAAQAGPRHIPKACGSCGAPIFWAQTESGRSMPVDATPVLDGNVVLYDHRGSIRARVLKKGEQPGPREKTRLPHHMTCPQGKDWKRRR